MLKILMIVFYVLILPEKKAFSNDMVKPNDQLIEGRAWAIVSGLGIGHARIDEWNNKGYIYTAGELGAFFLTAFGLYILDGVNKKSEITNRNVIRNSITLTGLGVYTGFRLVEIYDIFSNYSVKNHVNNNINNDVIKTSLSKILFSPFASVNSYGMIISYKMGM